MPPLQTDTDSEHEILINNVTCFAQSRMQGLHSSHGWDHVVRVLTNANIISVSEEKADRFIVTLAVLLHDIARSEENTSKGKHCHAVMGARIASNFLDKEGLAHEQIKAVAHCIETHRFRGNNQPQSIEARIVHDADKLDSIGAVGIGRAFLFSGEIGARLHNRTGDVSLTDAYSEEDTAYREYIHKLQYVRDRMLTPKGRELAAVRNEFMKIFFDRLHNEINGSL